VNNCRKKQVKRFNQRVILTMKTTRHKSLHEASTAHLLRLGIRRFIVRNHAEGSAASCKKQRKNGSRKLQSLQLQYYTSSRNSTSKNPTNSSTSLPDISPVIKPSGLWLQFTIDYVTKKFHTLSDQLRSLFLVMTSYCPADSRENRPKNKPTSRNRTFLTLT